MIVDPAKHAVMNCNRIGTEPVMSHRSNKWLPRTPVSILGGLLLGTHVTSCWALEPLELNYKEHLWKESHYVRVQTDFECKDMHSAFKAEMSRVNELQIVSVQVNGRNISKVLLQQMKGKLKQFGPYDYVYFSCAGDSYSFIFRKWRANQPVPDEISVSDRLENLGK